MRYPNAAEDAALAADGEPACVYCDGAGEIEMDNNGPIVPCPICEREAACPG